MWVGHAHQSEEGERDGVVCGNQNQLQLWGISFRGFTGGSSKWGRDGRKRGWMEGASDDVDGGAGGLGG